MYVDQYRCQGLKTDDAAHAGILWYFGIVKGILQWVMEVATMAGYSSAQLHPDGLHDMIDMMHSPQAHLRLSKSHGHSRCPA